MADTMFPGASALGDSVNELFAPPQSQANAEYRQIQQENHLFSAQDQGVNHSVLQGGKANIADQNSPQYGNEKNKPTATEDPQDVEDRWMARLAKFAGIAGATGVKLGGL